MLQNYKEFMNNIIMLPVPRRIDLSKGLENIEVL